MIRAELDVTIATGGQKYCGYENERKGEDIEPANAIYDPALHRTKQFLCTLWEHARKKYDCNN